MSVVDHVHESTTASPATGRRGGLPATAPVPFHRLVRVELRKMVDTRAGRWLLITMSVVAAAVAAAVLLWGPADETTFGTLLGLTSFPLIMVLPILGTLTATAEWSQRTGLVTFTLEPRRGRVVAAKVVASLLLGLIVTASAFTASALANVLGSAAGDASGAWDVTWKVALGLVLVFAIYVLQGVGFGFLFLNTPLAIVASLVLPTLWPFAMGLASSLEGASRWLDLNQVTEPLLSGSMTGEDWGHLATSTGVWVVLPMLVGAYRVLTREVK